jgi:hypothetical protein
MQLWEWDQRNVAEMNRIETASLGASCLTLYCGLMILETRTASEQNPSGFKTAAEALLVFCVVVVNAWFLYVVARCGVLFATQKLHSWKATLLRIARRRRSTNINTKQASGSNLRKESVSVLSYAANPMVQTVFGSNPATSELLDVSNARMQPISEPQQQSPSQNKQPGSQQPGWTKGGLRMMDSGRSLQHLAGDIDDGDGAGVTGQGDLGEEVVL